MERQNVWSKDFTLITVGTIISAIGGQAISLPMSLMVFDETGSTLLSGFMFIATLLPNVILPILIAPFIDRYPKKKIIVGIGLSYGSYIFINCLYCKYYRFKYYFYLALSLMLGIISSIYQLAYQAWFPDLIPIGFEQQGYAVSSSIYPTIMIVMSPVSAYLYKTLSISTLFVIIEY